jgi:hypothetical protein
MIFSVFKSNASVPTVFVAVVVVSLLLLLCPKPITISADLPILELN